MPRSVRFVGLHGRSAAKRTFDQKDLWRLSLEFILFVDNGPFEACRASIIAAPVGYYFSDKWLNSFAYHTPLSLLPFLTAGTLEGLLAFVTVGSQAIKIVFRRPSVML